MSQEAERQEFQKFMRDQAERVEAWHNVLFDLRAQTENEQRIIRDHKDGKLLGWKESLLYMCARLEADIVEKEARLKATKDQLKWAEYDLRVKHDTLSSVEEEMRRRTSQRGSLNGYVPYADDAQ